MIKQKFNDIELLFDTNVNIYKSGDLPPTSDSHICSRVVTSEEYDLIMKIRRHKRKLTEEEFDLVKRENTAQLLSDGALTSVEHLVKPPLQ